MTEIISTLHQLGIEEKQAQVYLACLELGSATIHELAEKSGVKRTSIYNFLSEMKQAGLVSEIKQGKKILLVAENPRVLIQRAKNQVKKVEELLPEMMSIFNQPGNKPKVRYYEGENGLRHAWDDMLASGEDIYGFSDYEKMFTAFSEDFLLYVPETRVKNKQKFYCIAKDGEWGRKIVSKDKEHFRETRLVKDIELDTEINIYGNKVMMLSFRRPYAAVIIEDAAIARSQKSIWEMVWKSVGRKGRSVV